jgi:Domain of unknown function (DUF4410)
MKRGDKLDSAMSIVRALAVLRSFRILSSSVLCVPGRGSSFWTLKQLASGLLAVSVVAGCAWTKTTHHEELVAGRLPRPGHIWVYDFAATPADVPRSSGFVDARYQPAQSQSSEEIAAGRQAGTELATKLVEQIQQMGLPAERASTNTRPRINDMVLRGYFVSIDKGSAAKRLVIGFGSGAAQLTTAVEGYQMTARGLRKLGADTVQSGGNKMPGEALGIVGFLATSNPAGLVVGSGVKAVGEASGSSRIEGRTRATAREIASQLSVRFQQWGWVS